MLVLAETPYDIDASLAGADDDAGTAPETQAHQYATPSASETQISMASTSRAIRSPELSQRWSLN